MRATINLLFWLAIAAAVATRAQPSPLTLGNSTITSSINIQAGALRSDGIMVVLAEYESPWPSSSNATLIYFVNVTTNVATYAGQFEAGAKGFCMKNAQRAYVPMGDYVVELAFNGANATNISRFGVDTVVHGTNLTSSAATSDFGRSRTCAVDAEGNLYLAIQAHTSNPEPMEIVKVPVNGPPKLLLRVFRDAATVDGTAAIRWSNARGVLLTAYCVNGGSCYLGHFDDQDEFHFEYNCTTPPCGLDSRAVDVDSDGVFYAAKPVFAFDDTRLEITRIFPDGHSTLSTTYTPAGLALQSIVVVNSTTLAILRTESTTFVGGYVVSPPQAAVPSYGYCDATTDLAPNEAPGDFIVGLQATAINGTHMTVQTRVSYKPNVTGRAGPTHRQPRVIPGSFPTVGAVLSITNLTSVADFWEVNDYGRNCIATQNVTLAWSDVCKAASGGQLWCYANVSVLVPDVASAGVFQSTRRTVAFAPPYQDVTISASGQLYRLTCSGTTDTFSCLLLPMIPIAGVGLLNASGWAPSGCAVSTFDPHVFTCNHDANVSRSYNATFRLTLGADTLDILGRIFVPRPPTIGTGNATTVNISIAPITTTFSNVAPVVVDINGATGFVVVSSTVTAQTTPPQVFTLNESAIVTTPINATAQRVSVYVGTLLQGHEAAFMNLATLVLTLRVFTSTTISNARHMRALAATTLLETPEVGVRAAQGGENGASTLLPVWGIAAIAVGAGVVVAMAGILVRRAVVKRRAAAATETAKGVPAVENGASAAGNPLDEVRAFDVEDRAPEAAV